MGIYGTQIDVKFNPSTIGVVGEPGGDEVGIINVDPHPRWNWSNILGWPFATWVTWFDAGTTYTFWVDETKLPKIDGKDVYFDHFELTTGTAYTNVKTNPWSYTVQPEDDNQDIRVVFQVGNVPPFTTGEVTAEFISLLLSLIHI